MVELNINSSNWQDFGKDYYVSVRVGEVQKLSRIAGNRTYKFSKSAVGTRRYGKVEVFKRVGAGAVCLEGDSVGGEVTITCESKPLNLDVQVSGGPGKDEIQVGRSGELNDKAKSAKEYLENHHLELRLSEAMQAVLRDKPDDPGAYIAKRLSENKDLVPAVKPREPEKIPAAKSVPNLGVPKQGFQMSPSVGTWHSPRPNLNGRIAAHNAIAGQVVECGKTNKRGLVKSKTQTELLVECLETGKEEWKPIEDQEIHARKMAHNVKEGESVGNVRSGKRGKVLERTTTEVLISQGDGAQEWQTIEELEKVGDVPTNIKGGEKARNFKSGVKGRVLTRTFTDVKLKLEDGTEEWHEIEDLEADDPKMITQSNFRLGGNFLTFGMQNMVHLI